ncbi:MAG: barstar family protein [Oscillospiraceae bacterium]|nr:barstar family protein [Oscillospiraceae bacterium]
MQAIINGNHITDRDSLHALLREKLQLPEDCGRNLDAVYDILTEPGKPRIITIKHEAQLRRQLGDYADRFLQMLEDAAQSGHVQLLRK